MGNLVHLKRTLQFNQLDNLIYLKRVIGSLMNQRYCRDPLKNVIPYTKEKILKLSGIFSAQWHD